MSYYSSAASSLILIYPRLLSLDLIHTRPPPFVLIHPPRQVTASSPVLPSSPLARTSHSPTSSPNRLGLKRGASTSGNGSVKCWMTDGRVADSLSLCVIRLRWRVSELRVVELLDGLCDKMQDYTLMKIDSTKPQWVKVDDWDNITSNFGPKCGWKEEEEKESPANSDIFS
ncbi:hypothetical protein Droror1_Dr00026064 [Drosera rotundifolia]